MQSSDQDASHRKRRRSTSRGPLDPSSPWGASGESDGGHERASSIPPSSLPTSSPPGAMSDLTDGEEAEDRSVIDEGDVRDLDDEADDDEGEDLFGDQMERCVSALTQ